MPLTRPSMDFIQVNQSYSSADDGKLVVYRDEEFVLEAKKAVFRYAQIAHATYDAQTGTLSLEFNNGVILKAHGFPTPSTLPSGPRGREGEAGIDGKPARDGLDGSKGVSGCQGGIGPEGNRGQKGETGDVGSQGSRGDPGPIGAIGRRGPRGERGEIGLKGPVGDPGLDADDGTVNLYISETDPGDVIAQSIWVNPAAVAPQIPG
jgi:hypothetical protein